MAFETDGGGGEDALEFAAAMRAYGDLGIRELLDLFSVLVAVDAFVFVERHDVSFLVPDLIVMREEARRCGFDLLLLNR